MRKEYATLKRRPFLMPVWLSVLAGVCVLGVGLWALGVASPTVVVVVPVGRGGDTPDLVLAAVGEARAALLSPLLGPGEDGTALRPEAIYASQSPAATGLAQPLARHLSVVLTTVPAGDPRGYARAILRAHRGHRIVAVTDEADVAALVHALAGGEVAVPAHSAVVIAIPRFSRPAVLGLGFP